MLFKDKDKCMQQNPNFSYDEACLDIVNKLNETISIYGQYVECHKCDYQNLININAKSNYSMLIDTRYSMRMYYSKNGSEMCNWEQSLLEHYRYGWNISEKCVQPYIIKEADNAYIPILTAFIILFFFGTIWYMIKCVYKCTKNNIIWRRLMWNSTEMENDLGSTTDTPLVIERPPAIRKHPNRIKSIDVFRGFCIMVMIFVNYGGGKYWFFNHSVWNGITVADLVFPWFLWIMGLSMSISFNSKLRNAIPRRTLIISVIKRSVILFALGIILNSHGHSESLETLRIFGVLQRIGICYLIVGLLEATFAKRVNEPDRPWNLVSDYPQRLVILSFIVIHTCITFLVDVPGCGKGYLGPGGLDNGGNFTNCTGGVAGYIDRAVLGRHVYHHKDAYKKIYEATLDFDPEGILGILTSTVIVFFGVVAGRILHTYTSVYNRAFRWTGYGIILSLLGGILCNFTLNDGTIPLNKRLWSLSFVFVMSGLAYLIFTFLFVVVDITRKWGGRPFFYPGMNPLVLYVLHIMLKQTFPVAWNPNSETHAAYLGMNLWATTFWVCFSIFLYKRNIFISI